MKEYIWTISNSSKKNQQTENIGDYVEKNGHIKPLLNGMQNLKFHKFPFQIFPCQCYPLVAQKIILSFDYKSWPKNVLQHVCCWEQNKAYQRWYVSGYRDMKYKRIILLSSIKMRKKHLRAIIVNVCKIWLASAKHHFIMLCIKSSFCANSA